MDIDAPVSDQSAAHHVAGGSMRRDVTSAYVAAGARVGAWALVSAIVYRRAGPADFAMLALIRGTIGILNYTSVGLSPALIRLFALAGTQPGRDGDVPDQLPPTNTQSTEKEILSTAIVLACATGLAGLVLSALYASQVNRFHSVPPSLTRAAPWAVIFIGLGTLLRLFSDTFGAVLQTRGQIALDNCLLAASDLFWAATALALLKSANLLNVSIAFAAAATFLVMIRAIAAWQIAPGILTLSRFAIRLDVAGRLLSFGALVLLSQLAEYFYAPTDYILINHFFSSVELAAYAPGVQIDLGLLMLVSGVAAVLLPRSALAHAQGNRQTLRRYYLRGTFASTSLLAIAGLAVWLLYPALFRIWFGPNPPDTGAILDLVLIGTVVGGSSAVGRSVLIGMGRIKPFTIAAILAGVVNVIASYCFVKYCGLGLRGILYGTLIAVIGRCGVWMPWYVLRTLGRE